MKKRQTSVLEERFFSVIWPSFFSSLFPYYEQLMNKDVLIKAKINILYRKMSRSRHWVEPHFTTLLSMVVIRKTCGTGGQNKAQLQPTNRHTSWSGEKCTPGLRRQTESELSSIYVNDGVWDNRVCIDYRICLMGHNSLQGCQGSVMPLNCELCSPHKSTNTDSHRAVLGLCGCLCCSNFNPSSMASLETPTY